MPLKVLILKYYRKSTKFMHAYCCHFANLFPFSSLFPVDLPKRALSCSVWKSPFLSLSPFPAPFNIVHLRSLFLFSGHLQKALSVWPYSCSKWCTAIFEKKNVHMNFCSVIQKIFLTFYHHDHMQKMYEEFQEFIIMGTLVRVSPPQTGFKLMVFFRLLSLLFHHYSGH